MLTTGRAATQPNIKEVTYRRPVIDCWHWPLPACLSSIVPVARVKIWFGVRPFVLSAAFVGLFIIAQLPPRFFELFSPILFGFGLLLLSPLLVGEVGKGAQRWLDIGPVTIQPSEIMKLAVPMMIAWYVNRRAIPIRLGRLVIALTLVLIPYC